MTVTLTVLAVLAVVGYGTGLVIISNSKATVAKFSVAAVAGEMTTAYNDLGSFPTVTQMPTYADSSYTYVDGSSPSGLSTSPKVISVYQSPAPAIVLAALSSNGSCYAAIVYPPSVSTPDAHVIDPVASHCYASYPFSLLGQSW